MQDRRPIPEVPPFAVPIALFHDVMRTANKRPGQIARAPMMSHAIEKLENSGKYPYPRLPNRGGGYLWHITALRNLTRDSTDAGIRTKDWDFYYKNWWRGET